MSVVQYCLDEYEGAVEAYHCRIQINPDLAVLHADLGNTYVLGLYNVVIE